jgi:hypothetical protein
MAADVGNLLALIDLDYRQASTDFLSQCTELNDPLNLSGLVRPPADKIGASVSIRPIEGKARTWKF